MKLIRFGNPGEEKPGIIVDEKRFDVSTFGTDYTRFFLENNGLKTLNDWFIQNQSECPIVDPSTRLGSPIKDPSKIICVGLNYRKHAIESGMQVPEEPVLFFKATSALCGPNDNVMLPRNGNKTDWEVELAVVIEKKASYVSIQNAMNYIGGYALHLSLIHI